MTNLKNKVYTEVRPGPAEKQFPVLEYSATEIPDPTSHEMVHRMGTVLSGSPFNIQIPDIHPCTESAQAQCSQGQHDALQGSDCTFP